MFRLLLISSGWISDFLSLIRCSFIFSASDDVRQGQHNIGHGQGHSGIHVGHGYRGQGDGQVGHGNEQGELGQGHGQGHGQKIGSGINGSQGPGGVGHK